jgi:hypothetical protein
MNATEQHQIKSALNRIVERTPDLGPTPDEFLLRHSEPRANWRPRIAVAATTRSRRRNPWILAGGITAAVALAVTVTVTNNHRGPGPSTVAMIQMPALIDTANDCGTVTSRPATPDETARVAHLPRFLPDGYFPTDTPSAFLQERAVASIDCWNADVTYVDAATGRILTATVNRQGNEVQAGCQLPDGYLPAECVTIGDRSAALTHEGTRATASWITGDDQFAYVSGYGLTTDELLAAAETMVFDGTRISIQTPTGMDQVEDSPRTGTDNRDITYYGATFSNGDAAADISLSVTTWNDISVNEVGPATTIDLDGVTAVVVTTGGPGTGIIGWATGAQSVDQPAGSFITWNRDGLTFRIKGPDPDSITFVAQQLEAT